ncbi:hypothetical protein EOW65_02030 [Sinirhodobacter ferrireducens]|uniref:Uncharacterized protein n=1 Tax=Paenirhodobacter ferrireducens TaxID=1215032 RepID=A0A443LT70_9RHOB|nr:H-type lectin domain-containing protein [Sinirhodobacter ferrireducens]RWR52380.1 hypothetical protein EOW65_02030 [Sinirhodobacter ferrireducens]
MEMRFWQPLKRPAQDAVPAHVRKIWLARDCFAGQAAAQQSVAAQEVLHAGPEALVLRGHDTLRTQPHSAFSERGVGRTQVQLLLWVPFRQPFSEPPAVSLRLVQPLPCDVRATQVAPDGFQIRVQSWGEIAEPELEVLWKAAGFPESAAPTGAAN